MLDLRIRPMLLYWDTEGICNIIRIISFSRIDPGFRRIIILGVLIRHLGHFLRCLFIFLAALSLVKDFWNHQIKHILHLQFKAAVALAELDEESFRYLLWDHKPLTDFWQTGSGTVRRLKSLGIHTMGELARFSLTRQDMLYDRFGVDAEILIDHAWGLEPCTMQKIKAYRPSSTSISEGQVLKEPYTNAKARIIVQEMAENLSNQLLGKKLATDGLVLTIGYDRENCDKGLYTGPVHIDHYGRKVPKPAHGSTKLNNPTNLSSQIITAAVGLFDQISNKPLTIRRITIASIRVVKDEGIYQMDLFTDTKKLDKEKQLQQTMLDIKQKYGKNAVLKGTSYMSGATMRERNEQIGGHKAK